MRIISHRGILDNQDPSFGENSPMQIDIALRHNFDVEIDIRYNPQNKSWHLGHDKAQHIIDWGFIEERKYNLYIHAKNIITLRELTIKAAEERLFNNNRRIINYFYHEQDNCALTSLGFLWSFPRANVELTDRSIAVMPERVHEWTNLENCYAICTDYPFKYQEQFNK